MIELEYEFHDQPMPIRYLVFRCEMDEVTVDRVRQIDGSYRWAIRNRSGDCLSNAGEWDHESMPSHRHQEWMDAHRYDEFADAWGMAVTAAKLMLEEYKERVERHNASE